MSYLLIKVFYISQSDEILLIRSFRVGADIDDFCMINAEQKLIFATPCKIT